MDRLIKAAAKRYLDMGYSVIPIGAEKIPAIKWKQYQESKMSPGEWKFTGCNIGVVTGAVSGIVVVDCDSDASYAGWLKHRPHTPMRVRSRRGMHFWYRHPGVYIPSDSHIKAAEGFEYDIKGDRSYAMSPPSLANGHQYQICVCRGNIRGKLLSPGDLPLFDPAWRPERRTTSEKSWDSDEIRDVQKYISKIRAIEGQGGDKATYIVSCRLAETCSSQMEAMALFVEWNRQCADPPWSTEQLHRKLKRAYMESKQCRSVTM